jgi:hypothetical protein
MNSDLPVKKENFLAEAEVMDLSKIKDKLFAVAVSTGPVDGVKYVCSTIHGPFGFTEMVQEVGEMWQTHQHHSKVIIMSKKNSEKVVYLDANTVDYIELNYSDIIVEEMLGGAYDKEFTCQAGLLEEEESTDPRHAQKALPAPKEDDEDALR